MFNDELKELLLSRGASLVGFADLGEIAPEVRYNLPFGISIAVALNPEVMSGIRNGPTRAYCDEYHRLNSLLSNLGQVAESSLRESGYRAVALYPTLENNLKTLNISLPHKTVATRAGLGWIGKCALLVTREFGSAVRLTSVLTDAPLIAGQPVNTSLCGDCVACIEACPAHAPLGKNWRAGVPRELLYDAPACREKARELAMKVIGIRQTICGLCIVTCPWTKKYLEKA